jgi:hypothetical protein
MTKLPIFANINLKGMSVSQNVLSTPTVRDLQQVIAPKTIMRQNTDITPQRANSKHQPLKAYLERFSFGIFMAVSNAPTKNKI